MKHLKKFEKYRIVKNREDIIKESVLQVNDIYKVRTMIDLPQSLLNSYVKKVKDTTGKNLRQFFGDVDIAEEIVKYINTSFLNVDQIPAGALMGDAQAQPEGQGQPQTQPQAQTQVQSQVQPQGQPQAQVQPQAQGQGQAQPEGQGQVQAQPQGQVQVQTEAQPQGQGQAQAQDDDFENIQDEEEEDEEDELPL